MARPCRAIRDLKMTVQRLGCQRQGGLRKEGHSVGETKHGCSDWDRYVLQEYLRYFAMHSIRYYSMGNTYLQNISSVYGAEHDSNLLVAVYVLSPSHQGETMPEWVGSTCVILKLDVSAAVSEGRWVNLVRNVTIRAMGRLQFEMAAEVAGPMRLPFRN
ncbi:hypothetical protein BJY01DRAFT_245485 [Aspergillus pseudoustus]|uniref:Uncharacterized protein n=1 Tax=Aspergillus pseudoustus TaxID=1810923 RepID=A0ABR4KDF2_9EURO